MSRAAHVLGLISLVALTPALAQAPARQDSAGLAWLAQTVNGRALIRVSGRWGTAQAGCRRPSCRGSAKRSTKSKKRLGELEERVDFAGRLLAKQRDGE